jgi:hypothetical protein
MNLGNMKFNLDLYFSLYGVNDAVKTNQLCCSQNNDLPWARLVVSLKANRTQHNLGAEMNTLPEWVRPG